MVDTDIELTRAKVFQESVCALTKAVREQKIKLTVFEAESLFKALLVEYKSSEEERGIEIEKTILHYMETLIKEGIVSEKIYVWAAKICYLCKTYEFAALYLAKANYMRSQREDSSYLANLKS